MQGVPNMNDQRSKDGVVHLPNGGWKRTDEAYHSWLLKRIMRKVTKDPSGCWLWHGHKHPKGYGMTAYRGKTINLHRAVYIATHNVRLLTEQLICHRCDVRHCVNPDHLFIGTAADNNRDCGNKGRHHNSVKTHCKRGHEFTFENTHLKVTATTVMRVCKECTRIKARKEYESGKALERQRRYRARMKAQRQVSI
jgi:hypothetical protein